MFTNIQIEREIYKSDMHQMVRATARDFFAKEIVPYHDKWEEEGMISREAWLKAGEQGLLCVTVPEEYGGAGLDFSFSSIICEELSATGCTGPGFFLHSDITTPYIVDYGTEEQKKKWLPKMVSGETITAIGMTEPGAGSDLRNLRTTAVDMGDHYLVNGSKTFITNGYMSDLVITAVRTEVGISLLLIEADREGFTKGQPFKKVGLKAQDTCELFFEDVKVPKENLLGEEGKGFIYMMEELAQERLSVAVISMGVIEAALNHTIEYVETRRAFGQPVAGFQNTQFKLAELATKIQIHQVFLDKCIQLLIDKKLTPEQASMAKLSFTELQCEVMDECVQLHGGYGYIWEYFVARAYADARVQRIYAGTNEIMKVIISRGLLKNYFRELKAAKRAKALAES